MSGSKRFQCSILKVQTSDNGPVAQLVRAPPCHGGGQGFKSLSGRSYGVLAQLGEHLPYKQRVIGSSPIGPIYSVIVLYVICDKVTTFCFAKCRLVVRTPSVASRLPPCMDCDKTIVTTFCFAKCRCVIRDLPASGPLLMT